MTDAKFSTASIAALHTVSPALAALYAVRARRSGALHHELSPLHCTRCGHVGIHTRLERVGVRTRSRSSARNIRTREDKRKDNARGQHAPLEQRSASPSRCSLLRRICHACGFVNAQAIDPPPGGGLKASFPKVGSSRTNTLATRASVPVEKSEPAQRMVHIAPPAGVPEMSDASSSSLPRGVSSSALASIDAGNGFASRGATPAQPSPGPSDEAKPPASSASTKRPKKKAGLQEMLARSREQKARKEGGAQTPESGLADFLSGL